MSPRSQIQCEPNQQAAAKKRLWSLFLALSFGVGVAAWAWRQRTGASGAIHGGDSHIRSPPLIGRRKSNSWSGKLPSSSKRRKSSSWSGKLPSSRLSSQTKLRLKNVDSWAGAKGKEKIGLLSQAFLSSNLNGSYRSEKWAVSLELCEEVVCFSILANEEETDTWIDPRDFKPRRSANTSGRKIMHSRTTSIESGITLPDTDPPVLRGSKTLPNPIPKIHEFLEEELQRTINIDLVIKFVNELRGIKTMKPSKVIDKQETRRFTMGMVEKESKRPLAQEKRSLLFDEDVSFSNLMRASTVPTYLEDLGFLEASFALRKMTRISEASSTDIERVPSLMQMENDPTNGEMKLIDAELQSVNAKLKKMRLKSIDWLTRGQGTNGFYYELEEAIQDLESKKKTLQTKYDTACETCIYGLMTDILPVEGDEDWELSLQSPASYGALHDKVSRSKAFSSPSMPLSFKHEQKIDVDEADMKSRYDAAFRDEVISMSRDNLDFYG